ncbi:uncharacterized protein N7477_008287 [Penicillium maclennaniae]|uniref:uncharacterized protein n=1 Tax=Penicillium maclennaniae TaxID=1343394 RepID=UPI0025409E53|nr:uncharacterized protein N7477_008287 [Penicillium maclennaniae]KAJ5665839.1 hypothetical protein N7477_008287 [Penicillium maclennaniae]
MQDKLSKHKERNRKASKIDWNNKSALEVIMFTLNPQNCARFTVTLGNVSANADDAYKHLYAGGNGFGCDYHAPYRQAVGMIWGLCQQKGDLEERNL